MQEETLFSLAHWINEELGTLDHGEVHVTLKVRDKKIALIEKTKIEKRNLSNILTAGGEISWLFLFV